MTFGCSFVYGDCLPDCYIPPDKPGPVPSQLSWPSLLAQKLDRRCLNLAICGAGNLELGMSILRTDFQTEDLVIIAYSYFDRFNLFKFTDFEGNGKQLIKNRYNHKKMILLELGEKNLQQQSYWSNWLMIHHIELFLKSKNIEHYYYLGIPENIKKPNNLQLENFWDDLNLIRIDHALDNQHPGIESHKLQSELIYTKIKDRELH